MKEEENTKIIVEKTKIDISISDGFNFGIGFFFAGFIFTTIVIMIAFLIINKSLADFIFI